MRWPDRIDYGTGWGSGAGLYASNQGKQVIPAAQQPNGLRRLRKQTVQAVGRVQVSYSRPYVRREKEARGTVVRERETGHKVVRQIEAYKRSKYLYRGFCFFISSIPFERENKVTTFLPITLIYFSLRLHTFLLQNYSGSQATHANHALRSPQRPRHRRFETHSRGSGVQVDGEVLESSHHFFVKHGREGMRRG